MVGHYFDFLVVVAAAVVVSVVMHDDGAQDDARGQVSLSPLASRRVA